MSNSFFYLHFVGGCKHAVAFLACLYRRSEEPSPTSIACYWQKPELSEVGSNIKFIKIKDILKNFGCAVGESDIGEKDFLSKVLNYKTNTDTQNFSSKFFSEFNLALQCSLLHWEQKEIQRIFQISVRQVYHQKLVKRHLR